ncbi:MAG: cobalt ECF transporter T component CbiQ [Elusimicrobiota bacterium]|nr:cobalt ECF transporter T component CbiQ [Elusimicrobiota bacterium]
MKHSYIDKYCGLGSFLHRLDPRVKILPFFVFILLVVSVHPYNFNFFAVAFLLILFLMAVSKVPLKHFAGNVRNVMPFAVLVVIFVPFFSDKKLAKYVMTNTLVKSFLSVLILTVFSATTRFSDFLAAISKLGFPKIFVMILSFMYRYIFVLVEEKERMTRAALSRYYEEAPGFAKFLRLKKWYYKTAGNIIGSFFVRTYDRSERIYYAMCSRGFDGDIKTMELLTLKMRDIFFLTGFSSLLLLMKIYLG